MFMCFSRNKLVVSFQIILFALLFGLGSVSTAKVGLSNQQLEYIKNLSDEEKRELARELGIEVAEDTDDSQYEAKSIVKERKVKNKDAKNKTIHHDKKHAKHVKDEKNEQKYLYNKRNADDAYDNEEQDESSEEDEYLDEDHEESYENPQEQDTRDDEEEVDEEQVELQAFGYDLFAGEPSTFAPLTEVPVPSEYVLGPGDVVKVQLFGKENESYELPVDRQGNIGFPGIGPITVAGLQFDEVNQVLQKRIEEQIIGVSASITLGTLRSIQIFVLGEGYKPGLYTVSALTTITNALYLSGGISERGSLRNIQLKRQGKHIVTVDLYDLLLKGNTENDARLQSGDVIFIPPVKKTAAVAGAVRRPAIYELKNEQTVDEAIEMAGGLLADAYQYQVTVERVDNSGDKTVLDINLVKDSAREKRIKNGDYIRIPSVLEKLENVVNVTGHIHRPGAFSWRQGIRVSDVIQSVSQLKAKPDLEFALIKREIQPTREITVVHLNLGKALTNPGGQDDLILSPRDELLVFGVGDERVKELTPLVDELEAQNTYNHYAKTVVINGHVRYPGKYPIYEGMTLKGLLSSAYDLKSDADIGYILLKRLVPNTAKIVVRSIDLNALDVNEVKIMPQDEVIVFNQTDDRTKMLMPIVEALRKQASKLDPERVVSIQGHVRFPGDYPLEPGMTVKQLVKAAGGLAKSAFSLVAEITRYKVIDDVERTVEHHNISLTRGEDTGYLYKLQPYDTLHIKQLPDWSENESVEISGEVRFPGTYTIKKGEKLSNLIKRAGGLTRLAHVEAAVFARQDLKDLERQRITQMREKLRKDILAQQLTNINKSKFLKEKAKQGEADLSDKMKVLEKLEGIQAIGRMIIDLEKIITSPNAYDVSLRDGDELNIPRYRQEVSVIGEVHLPSSHLFEPSLHVEDYVNLSGGVTDKSQDDEIFIIKASGAVVKPNPSRWFAYHNQYDISPGDTIVVPLDTDRLSSMDLWTGITQVLYQSAIAVAAVAAL